MLEVHGQEADVVQDITPSQPLVELEPVEDPGTVVEAEDVLGEQIAVPVHDAAAGDALVQQSGSPVQVAVRELGDPGDEGRIEGVGHERIDLAEVPIPQVAERTRRRHRGDLVARDRSGMARGHDPSDGTEAAGDVSVLGDERGQAAIRRHAPHQDRVVDHPPRVVDDLLDAEVDVRAEPPVQLDLLATDQLAALRRARGRRRRTAPASCACARGRRRTRATTRGSRRARHPAVTGRAGAPRRAGASGRTASASCRTANAHHDVPASAKRPRTRAAARNRRRVDAERMPTA